MLRAAPGDHLGQSSLAGRGSLWHFQNVEVHSPLGCKTERCENVCLWPNRAKHLILREQGFRFLQCFTILFAGRSSMASLLSNALATPGTIVPPLSSNPSIDRRVTAARRLIEG